MTNAKTEIPISVLMQYFRVPTGDLAVDYAGRPVLLGSRITNVSTTGVYVRTPKPLAKGTELEISFSLPGHRTKIKAKTVVRWSTEVDLPPGTASVAVPTGMGLEFVDLSAAHKKRVAAFVEEFLHRMRRDT